jgi:glycosyltransferase involved in cell wall biosynthesis
VILGAGTDSDDFARLVQGFGLADRVRGLGFQTNPYRYLARSTVLVLSSRREGLPTVLVEALALGVPVVATDCPSGPREILHDGRIGDLVPVGDSEALAAAIDRALATPATAAAREQAARQAERACDPARVTERFLGLLAARPPAAHDAVQPAGNCA